MDILKGDYKDEKIFIETETSTIEGTVVDSFDHEDDKLTLKNAVLYPLGKECHGLYQCCKYDVKNIYILKSAKDKKAEDRIEASVSPSFQPKWNYSCGTNHALTAEEYDALIGLAKDTVFIDCMDSIFDQAIEAIKNESVIGFDTEGASCGRNYEALLFSISTQTCVYQFDIVKLGMTAFDIGLRSILESEIWKVVHNSRLLSDCLYHKYLVKMNNVFDTQVGELMIEKNFCGEFPEYTCSLPDCVKIFLGIPPAVLQFNKDDTLMWMKRPLSKSLKFAAARGAVFLLPLEERIKAIMLSSVTLGMDIYLKIIRDAECDEATRHTWMNHLVPQEFLDLE